jgi:polyhydroxybutyrate depolymerase
MRSTHVFWALLLTVGCSNTSGAGSSADQVGTAGAGATGTVPSKPSTGSSTGPVSAGQTATTATATAAASGIAGRPSSSDSAGGTAQASSQAGTTSTASVGTSSAGASASVAGSVGAAGSNATAAAGGTAPATSEPQTCSASATGKAGRTTESLENAGVMRSFILHVPSSYKGDTPVPLVVFFHPLLTNADTAASGSGYTELANKEGFIVAYPDAQADAAWNVGPCCTQSRDVDDKGFARAVVKAVQAKLCVDSKRVYAAGFSMGGGMAHYMGCEAADVFAAIAPGSFDLLKENTCAPVRPISVIAFRSMSDAIVPYEGAVKTSAPNGFMGMHTFLGAVGTDKKWAELDGCTGEPVDEGGGCKTHKMCSQGVEVTLCTVPGGHTWPDAARSWQTLSRFTLP